MSGHAGRARGDRAQATVEVALVVPVVALLALGVVQVGVLVHDQVLITAAAREAVRAAAVSTSDADARHAANAVGGLDGARLELDLTRRSGEGGDDVVQVRLTYTCPTAVPLVGPLLPDVSLTARAVMRDET